MNNIFAIFANVLTIILRLAINATNQLFPFLLLLLLTLRVSNKSAVSTITISIVDLQNIIANTICMVGNASYFSSLLVTFGMSPSSWLIDSTCCNHMTPHSSLFLQLEPTPHPLNIHTTNGSTMFGHNIGSISTSNLSVLGVFNVPNFSYNLFFVGQLAELGYRIAFDYSGCIVQDPRMG